MRSISLATQPSSTCWNAR